MLVEGLPGVLDKLAGAECNGTAVTHPARLAARATRAHMEVPKLLEDEFQYLTWKEREQLSGASLSPLRLDGGWPLPRVSL